jgi:L-2-hydroxyglutarate oxidase
MVKKFDIAIIGGGLVGLATAHQLSKQYPRFKIAVLEKEDRVAAHQSGHNSGVIHSGLYYKPGSVKAATAVRGADLLKRFCAINSLPVTVCGKIVVAIDEKELPALDELYRRGMANGVPDLKIIGREQLREIEPHAAGIRALHVPHAGIVDYVQVAEKIAEGIRLTGSEIRLDARVTAISQRSEGWILHTSRDEIQAAFVVSCAGLYSDRVAKKSGTDPGARIVPFRGEYYNVRTESCHLVKGLIYPVPDPRFPFLGVHFTNLIHGGVEAGPNAVLAFKREGYKKSDFSLRDTFGTLTYPGFIKLARKFWRTGLNEMKRSYSKKLFVTALRKLVPEIQEKDLVSGGSGVRAQALLPNGNLVDDFLIVEGPRALHVCNAPSPAATASFAIAEEITKKAAAHFGLT